MDDELRKYFIDFEERFVKHIETKLEHLETTLVTAFRKGALFTDVRSAAIRALDLEMDALTDRVQKLEGGKPPQ